MKLASDLSREEQVGIVAIVAIGIRNGRLIEFVGLSSELQRHVVERLRHHGYEALYRGKDLVVRGERF